MRETSYEVTDAAGWAQNTFERPDQAEGYVRANAAYRGELFVWKITREPFPLAITETTGVTSASVACDEHVVHCENCEAVALRWEEGVFTQIAPPAEDTASVDGPESATPGEGDVQPPTAVVESAPSHPSAEGQGADGWTCDELGFFAWRQDGDRDVKIHHPNCSVQRLADGPGADVPCECDCHAQDEMVSARLIDHDKGCGGCRPVHAGAGLEMPSVEMTAPDWRGAVETLWKFIEQDVTGFDHYLSTNEEMLAIRQLIASADSNTSDVVLGTLSCETCKLNFSNIPFPPACRCPKCGSTHTVWDEKNPYQHYPEGTLAVSDPTSPVPPDAFCRCGHTGFHHALNGSCDFSRGGVRVDDCAGFVAADTTNQRGHMRADG